MKIKIEKGVVLVLPVYAIHHDPNLDKFDPERFSDENKSNIFSGRYLRSIRSGTSKLNRF